MATVKAKPAAGPNPRRPLSPETRAKIAAAHKGRPGHPQSPESRAKVAAARRGRPLSPETKAKISAARKDRRRGIPGSATEGGGT